MTTNFKRVTKVLRFITMIKKGLNTMYHSNKQEPFNMENIKKIAKELGIEILPNSSEPGMHFLYEDGSKEVMSFAEFSKTLKDFSKE